MEVSLGTYEIEVAKLPPITDETRELLELAEMVAASELSMSELPDWAAIRIESLLLPTRSLVATQALVDTDQVDRIFSDITATPAQGLSWARPLVVLAVGDLHLVVQGHHRLAARRARGVSHAHALVVRQAPVVEDPLGPRVKCNLSGPRCRWWLAAFLAPLACLVCPAHLLGYAAAIFGFGSFVGGAITAHDLRWELLWLTLGCMAVYCFYRWEKHSHAAHRCHHREEVRRD